MDSTVLAPPTLLGVVNRKGIELIPPIREGCCPAQIGRQGLSNHRWIVGVKLCVLVNPWGGRRVGGGHDTGFHPLIQRFPERRVILANNLGE